MTQTVWKLEAWHYPNYGRRSRTNWYMTTTHYKTLYVSCFRHSHTWHFCWLWRYPRLSLEWIKFWDRLSLWNQTSFSKLWQAIVWLMECCLCFTTELPEHISVKVPTFVGASLISCNRNTVRTRYESMQEYTENPYSFVYRNAINAVETITKLQEISRLGLAVCFGRYLDVGFTNPRYTTDAFISETTTVSLSR